uniref:Rhodanese domain-containing protein n=1 Tax=Cyprinus carpio TaxID=7962 RepID=A0A8C1REP8_CYPCA
MSVFCIRFCCVFATSYFCFVVPFSHLCLVLFMDVLLICVLFCFMLCCDCDTFTRMCAHPSCVSDDVVTYEQLKDMMSTGSVQLFDVREPDELEAGFIPGASNIPLGDVEQALRLNPDQFRERYGVPKPGLEDSDLVLYCQRGIRSLTALESAGDLGYSKYMNTHTHTSVNFGRRF